MEREALGEVANAKLNVKARIFYSSNASSS
jgi:hypothetical protein